MTPSQIAYYQSLPEGSKEILQAAALQTRVITDYHLQNIVHEYSNNRFLQKSINQVIENAYAEGLFFRNNDWHSNYIATCEFLVFIFPEIKIIPELWHKVNLPYNFGYQSRTIYEHFRNCLYALLYQPDAYREIESKVLDLCGHDSTLTNCYAALLEDERYDKYLHKISISILHKAIIAHINNAVNKLAPLSELKSRIEKIKTFSNHPELKDTADIEANIAFWSGNIDKAIELNNTALEYKAIKSLMEGRIEDAVAFFNKLIREQNKNGNKALVPERSYISYFYMLGLLLSDALVTVPAFRKIEQWMVKSNYSSNLFFSIIFDVLNVQRTKLVEMKSALKENIFNEQIDIISLLDILIYYLIGEKIDKVRTAHVYNILKKASNVGYWLLAYEAAFVAKVWFDDERIDGLFKDLSLKLNYQPIISRINRQEEWEKSLNLLLGMKPKSKSASRKDNNEIKNRVVYYFSPNSKEIQPVLQTRQAKGWSKGRNIALKTFYGATVEGMTDQDIRISKYVRYHDSYYDSHYFFNENVFTDLIGHPYVFLDNSNDVPVEFIAGQIVVSVVKTANGYQLATDLTSADQTVFVEKETNTRYKVYNLTDNQIRIIKIINEKKLIVPENGKAKLTELLGTFSAEGMAVHSDLVASDKNTSMEVKEVPADSRIRVQLLPLGNGLKTELFSKPFGERPPYCKPGKGGKVLISNERDIQLQVKRDLKKEVENEQLLLEDIQSLESLNENDGLFSFDDPMDALFLLDMLAKRQDVCVVEWPEGEKYRIRGMANINNLKINVTSAINWFDLQGELYVDENTVLTLQQLLRLTEKSHDRFIELSQGEFLALSDRLKKQLDSLRLFANEDKKGIHLNKFASVGLGDFFDEIPHIKADKAWKTFRRQIEKAKEENTPIPAALQTELRGYQEDGFRWMARLAEWNGGACLADDMGLGKTVQALAILLHRAQSGAALVICPVSVVNNWVNEAAKFAPTLRFKTFGTSSSNRKEILQSLEAGDVLVTSYGLLQSEEKLFAEPEFATVILDEAHVIKNYATKTSKATMQLKAGFRLILTGTPLQNHLGELWNLFNFINPGLLGSLQYFTDRFVKSGDEQSKKHLKKMIAPFILRRTKSAVLDELPPKTEIIKKIQLSDEERAFYEALRRQALENLSNADESKHIQVLAEITKLRQASCNPLLIDPMINISSSKLATFLDIVGELLENKHRALVFSQFVTHLAIIRQALDKQGISYQYLDGSTPQNERERRVKDFQHGEGELFLISLKAGGLGLNLTAADYVIHLDPWWNPAIEDQASDRAHRIGQQRPVTIYRLVAEDTIEEKIIQLHSQKRDLAEQLLEGSDMAARLSVREMVELIKDYPQ
jgi:SNF2 family DNA or RNA helicase